MNPSDIPRWLDEHGGADGPPQTDANGVTTHRARDGSYVTVYNGQVRMIGHGSQAAPGAETTTAPVQAAGGGMDQAALEARIAELQKQYPGLKFMGRSMKEKNRSRVDEDTGRTVTETVSVPVVEWRDPTTGYTLAAEVGPGGGTYTVTEDRLIPGNKGDAERGNQPPKEEPNPADPTRMRRWNPSTNQWEDAGPNAVEIERRQKAEAERNKPQTVATNTSEPFIVERQPDGTVTTRPNPNYKPPTPTTKQDVIRGSDGKDYTRVTIIDPTTNAITIKNFGPDGKQVAEIPGEGPSRPTVSGPPLPQIVLGASQDAARTYKEQLQEGVAAGRWSQAWADSRWREFMEVANLAVSEAATRQRNEESQRNAEFNIANARMGSMNTATSNALTFVNSINGLLPAGSNLGGQAFAALLGLNMLQSQMSGMNRIDPRRQPPQLTPAEISNPAALQARREQVQTQVQQAAAPPVRDDWNRPAQPQAPAPAPAPAPTPAPQPLSPGQAGMMSPVPDAENPPVAPQAPIEPAPPALGSAPAPAPAEAPPAAPPMTESGQRVAEQGTVILRHRLTGETRVMTRYQWEQEQARAGLLGRAANALWEEVGGAAPDRTVPPIQGPLVEEQAPAPEPQPSGGAFPPLPVVPRAGTEAGGNVQKVMPNPAGEWAALAPLAPMPMQQQPAMVGMAQMGEPTAARRARIASTPPWRLSEDDLLWSEQNGFGQEAWGVPGRVA